jgi:hypothetical protein
MRILVCGDREWTDYEMVLRVLQNLRPTVVIEGGQGWIHRGRMAFKGADACARYAAPLVTGNPSLRFDSDWKQLGKAAGPIRNQRMIIEGRPDLVIAFHDDLGRSKGTNDMLSKAERANIPTQLFNHRQAAATAP